MAVFEESWQKAKSTIRERGIFMLNNDLLSDVSLVVRTSSDENKPKKSKMAIPAHKFVLSICSPVFFAMFCGEMGEKSDTIDLPDCEYEGVLEMLRYLYSEEVKLNESNVMQVLYVAKKYILPSLADECVDFLIRNLDTANVICVLSHAQQYDEKSLADRCWEMIDRETEEVINSEGFATIERSLLEAIVKRDTLTITEVKLFKAVDLWAAKECERQGLATDGDVKRRILGEQIVKGIRFPAMKEKEFVSVVLDSNILTNTEMKELIKNFKGVLATPVVFPQDKRLGTYHSCCRFSRFAPYNVEGGWEYGNSGFGDDCIKFWVDKNVMLHGIRMFGRKDEVYYVIMTILDCHDNIELLYHSDESTECVPFTYKEAKIDVFDVWFEPVALKKNIKYFVRAEIAGSESCFGSSGVSTVQCQDVTFHFKDCKSKKCRDSTKVQYGQFAEFFFTPL